jgi:glycosyltransferase involved in cell wall biosynthesis
MMGVAIFTDNDFDKTNGVTTTLKALLRHAPPDLRLRIYTMSSLDVDEPGYLALRSLSTPIPFYSEMRMYVPRIREFRHRLVTDGIRLLHLTTPGPAGLTARYFASHLNLDAAAMAASGEGGRLPLVGSFHTNLAEYTTMLSGSSRLGSLMEKYMRWLYGACETVLTPSRDTIDRLTRRGWDPERLSLWPRGVDTAVFSPARRSQALRDHWRVCARRPAVLYAGRVSREKGLDLLEPLSMLLHRDRIANRLIIVGDGPMTAELRDRCPDAIFTGTLPHDEVAIAMASADVMVFPSQTDTAGNVVLEAQACGLPVVVADAGGPRENMRDGQTGFVCRSADADDFSRRIAKLLSDPRCRTEMGRAARSFAEERTWPTSLQPVYALYRSALTSTVVNPADRTVATSLRAASRV